MSYAIFSIPTKEARLFANKKPEIVSNIYSECNDELVELENCFNNTGYYDETISHYSIRRAEKNTLSPFNPAITYNKTNRTFSAELSSLGDDIYVDSHITFFNSKTGNSVVLKHYKTDKDSSGEDIYGWRYKGIGIDGKEFYFLLIND